MDGNSNVFADRLGTFKPAMYDEYWLSHLCNDEDRSQILVWLQQEGLSRPEGFAARMEHAQLLRKRANEFFGKEDFRRALHLGLGALHCLDFRPAEQISHSEDQRKQVRSNLVPVMSNLCLVFMRRGDVENILRAADAGLHAAEKLPDGEMTMLRAKLLYRRALARGEAGPNQDLAAARRDLRESARLAPADHEIRASLDVCSKLMRQGSKMQEPQAAAPATGATSESCMESNVQTLSRSQEVFAMVVGRSLGKAWRCCRRIRTLFTMPFRRRGALVVVGGRGGRTLVDSG